LYALYNLGLYREDQGKEAKGFRRENNDRKEVATKKGYT